MRFLFAAAALIAVAPAGAACPPLPGIDAVLARPGLQYLLFGEYHGTSEMPALVADALCSAAGSGRPVVLGVEFDASAQPSLDAYMASDGGAEARRAMLRAGIWREEGGRTTSAIMELIEAARRLGRRQRLGVVAFDSPPERGTSARREAAMAEALRKAGERAPGTLVIALTGAGHAGKTAWTSYTPPFPSAGQLLPAEKTMALSFARPGGRFWGCQPANGGEPEGCKSYDMPVREPVAPRGIVLDASIRDGFDGIYSTGSQYSASQPVLPKGG
nr:hypothetical protein [uncultured Sphingosinicella sp.]